MAYSNKVIDHYENPRNVGSLPKEDPNVGTGLVGAPECGDVMKLQLRISDAGIVEDAKFKTFGCGSAIASSSYVTELAAYVDRKMHLAADTAPASAVVKLATSLDLGNAATDNLAGFQFTLVTAVGVVRLDSIVNRATGFSFVGNVSTDGTHGFLG